MRISYGSSDVCSSDLLVVPGVGWHLAPAQSQDGLGEDVVEARRPVRCPHDVGPPRPVRLDQLHDVARPGGGGHPLDPADRESGGAGKSVSVRVDLGGRDIIKKQKHTSITYQSY